MQQTNLGKAYSDLPTWAKGILWVGGAVVAVGIIITIKNYIKKAKDTASAKETLKDATDRLQELQRQGIRPTASDVQYKTWADSIHSAMNGYGSDEEAIFNVMRNMKNEADVIMLIRAFDVRTISSGRFNVEPDLTHALPAAMTSELSSGEIKEVNDILLARGIRFQF